MKKKFNHKLGLNDDQIERLSDSNAMKIMGGESTPESTDDSGFTFGPPPTFKPITPPDGIPAITAPPTPYPIKH